MKTFSLLVFFFSSLFYNLIFAQGGLLTYQTVAIPVGATEFPVFLDLNVPDPPEGPADFFVQLTLQIIDKDLADDFSAVGENILTYPLSQRNYFFAQWNDFSRKFTRQQNISIC